MEDDVDFRNLIGWAKGHRNGLAVAALILVFAGVDLILNVPKNRAEQLFSIPLLAAGFLVLALILWPTEKAGPRPVRDTLARRILDWATLHGRLVPTLPVVGIAIIVADVVYNRFVSGTPAILENDVVALLFAAGLIAYPFVPARFERERDFILLFLAVLALILLAPLLIARSLSIDPASSVNGYSAVALIPETNALLNLLGVGSTVIPVTSGAPGIAFNTAAGTHVEVYITTACSGIYSFAIFSSAFSAYVLTEQRRLTARVAAFFVLGLFLAYFANILRMVVIVLVGYYSDAQGTGVEDMLVAHSNAGWLIFLAWISLFWFLLFRFLPPQPSSREGAPSLSEPPRRGAYCGICGIVLTPAIPATQCSCGRLYHVECLAGEGRCPSCEVPWSPPAANQSVP